MHMYVNPSVFALHLVHCLRNLESETGTFAPPLVQSSLLAVFSRQHSLTQSGFYIFGSLNGIAPVKGAIFRLVDFPATHAAASLFFITYAESTSRYRNAGELRRDYLVTHFSISPFLPKTLCSLKWLLTIHLLHQLLSA